MDAVNVIKGYDKVHDEIQFRRTATATTHSNRKRLKVIVIKISAVVLSTLIIGLLLAVLLIHESGGKEEKQLDAVDSLKTVCSVTRNPDSCFAALSSALNVSSSTTAIPKPDPAVILKLSLQVNVMELSNITYLLKNLDEDHPEAALRDCMDQLGDALSRLNDSIAEMDGDAAHTLTARKVNDLQTWVSAAMTDEETCLDGLEEMGSTVADQVKGKMKKSKDLLSYSLAIIANIQTLLHKFGITTDTTVH